MESGTKRLFRFWITSSVAPLVSGLRARSVGVFAAALSARSAATRLKIDDKSTRHLITLAFRPKT